MYFLKSTLILCIWSVGDPNESSHNNNLIPWLDETCCSLQSGGKTLESGWHLQLAKIQKIMAHQILANIQYCAFLLTSWVDNYHWFSNLGLMQVWQLLHCSSLVEKDQSNFCFNNHQEINWQLQSLLNVILQFSVVRMIILLININSLTEIWHKHCCIAHRGLPPHTCLTIVRSKRDMDWT